LNQLRRVTERAAKGRPFLFREQRCYRRDIIVKDMSRFFSGIFCILFVLVQGASADFRFSPHFNKARLIQWRSWNMVTLEEAKRENKPIFLSLSAVWCHWCHVMDETTYSDDDVIRFINENFIPVRVDADMRPDIDSLYNQGGWPSTLVLRAQGNIIHGGTYIPPEEMIPWLKRSLTVFREQSGAAKKEKRGKEEKTRDSSISPPEQSDIETTVRLLESEFDEKYGGFSGPQKFPNADAINFLLSEYVRRGDAEAKAVIVKTLDEMARGEIHDAVDGGFFRYATRSNWSSPHYEKMLDLNAELARNYAFAYQVFGKPLYRKITLETIDYVTGNLLDSGKGLFYGSQDADEHYYTSGKRAGLRRPNIDTVFYAGPNARMIRALVAAYGATGQSKYMEYATRAADSMIRDLYSPEEGVSRFYRNGEKGLEGLLEDNALFGQALLDLYEVTGQQTYSAVSRDIGRLLIGKFIDRANGGFRLSLGTTIVEPTAPSRLLEYKSAVSNFHAAVLLQRLSRQNGDLSLKRASNAAITAMGKSCERFGPAAPVCGSALRWEFQEPFEIVIVAGKRRQKFLSEVNKIFMPEKIVRILSMKKDKAEIARLGYPFEEALYLCFGKRCLAPAKRPEEVQEQISRFMKNLSAQ
jgi:uncharacterized protein YyaL (SSP411 family)